MAKISSYDIGVSPKLSDKLIGTSLGGSPVDSTFNFTLQSLLALFSENITLQNVLNAGNTANENIFLNGEIFASSINSEGILNGGKITPLLLKNSSSTTNTAVSLRLQTDPLSNVNSYSEIVGLRTGSPTNGGNRMIFLTTSATLAGASERMRLDYLGLGIGSSGTTTITDSRLGRFADGAANSPAYAFSDDVSTGMYRIGTNTLGFSTGGSEKMRIDSNGRVGIGITNPAAALDVQGNIFVRDSIYFANTEGSQVPEISAELNATNDLVFGDVTGGGKKIIFSNSGGVNVKKDVEVEDIASGIIIKSPNGTRHRITVANDGTLITNAVF